MVSEEDETDGQVIKPKRRESTVPQIIEEYSSIIIYKYWCT